MSYADKAKKLFKSGLNCSQAVFVAFADNLGIEKTQAQKLTVGLGGGVGRMREVCGAVSAAAMVLGMVYGGEDGMEKGEAYEKIQLFSKMFKEKNRYIVCRELRGLDKNIKETFKPDERTDEYYKSRPCADLVYDAAEILEQMLAEKS